MEKIDGSDLKFIETVAGNYTPLFGIFLLSDENGSEVKVLETEHKPGTEAVVIAIITKWLTKGSPDAPCTYEHLIRCLREARLGALAEDLADALGGMLYMFGLYTPCTCIK